MAAWTWCRQFYGWYMFRAIASLLKSEAKKLGQEALRSSVSFLDDISVDTINPTATDTERLKQFTSLLKRKVGEHWTVFSVVVVVGAVTALVEKSEALRWRRCRWQQTKTTPPSSSSCYTSHSSDLLADGRFLLARKRLRQGSGE